MQTLVITIHIIACISLVVLVLLQSGKEGMGVIFGGGGQSLFGGSGAGGLLTKLTAGVAAVFLCTSLTFTYISTKKSTSEQESIVLDAPASPGGEKASPEETPGASQQQNQEQSGQ
ncbi:MAG: preprotein translocase subunit SecG [Desulfonatronovibrionaceae bacterium]